MAGIASGRIAFAKLYKKQNKNKTKNQNKLVKTEYLKELLYT